jgi:hypothetical protein
MEVSTRVYGEENEFRRGEESKRSFSKDVREE